MVITREQIAYTEISNILDNLEKEYLEKIPRKLVEFFQDNSLEYCNLCFDGEGNIKLSPLAEEILCYLNLEYWSTKEEKQKLIEKYKQNEEKLRRQYDIDVILENRKYEVEKKIEQASKVEEDKSTKEKHLLVKKETIIQKIIRKIRAFFKI